MASRSEDLANALAGVISGLALTPKIKPYVWAPKPDRVTGSPFAVIEVPDVERAREPQLGLDGAGDPELGTRLFTHAFDVTLYYEVGTNPQTAQSNLSTALEAFIDAVDANPTLGLGNVDASVVRAQRRYTTDSTRVLVSYECRVEIDKLI